MNSDTDQIVRWRQSVVVSLISIGIGISVGLFCFIGFELMNRNSTHLHINVLQEVGDRGTDEARIQLFASVFESTVSIGKLAIMLDDLKENDFVNLLHDSVSISWNPENDIKQKLLLAALAKTAPAQALDVSFRFPSHRIHAFLKIVFAEWSHSNVNHAWSAADSLSSPFQEVAFDVIIRQNNISILPDNFTPTVNFQTQWKGQNAIANLSINQPEEAFNLLVGDLVSDYLQRELLIQSLDLWYQKDGFNVVAKLLDSKVPELLRQEILGQVTAKDRIGFIQYLNGLPVQQQLLFGRDMVTAWSDMDGRLTLEAVNNLKHFSTRSYFTRIAVRKWAEQNPLEVIENIELISRKQRASAVNVAIRTFAESNSASAAQMLESLRNIPGAVDIFAEIALVQVWTKQAPSKAVDWVQEITAHGSERRAQLMKPLLVQYTMFDPEEAMVLAIAEEPSRLHGMIGLEVYVIQELVNIGEVSTAIDLLPKVRAEARPMSFLHVGEELLRREKIEEAIQIAGQLETDEENDYYRRIVRNLAYSNTSRIFEVIPQLPTSKIRHNIVQMLLDNENLLDRLSQEQVASLQTFLSD